MFSSLRAAFPGWPRRRAGLPLSAMLAVARQRHMLAQLDDSRLEDLGISREEAEAEAQRPFWDAPSNWIR